jgi:hypothetical protein
MSELLAICVVGFAVMAWSQMHIDVRREMAGWFWLMLVAGAIGGTMYSCVRTGVLSIPTSPVYQTPWN